MDAAEMVHPNPGAARAELHCPRRESADTHLRLAYSLPFNDCPQLALTQPHSAAVAAQFVTTLIGRCAEV